MSEDESISEEESPVEHKISISALVTSLKEMQPKRKIPKRNRDIFAEWGHAESKVEQTKEDKVDKVEKGDKSEKVKKVKNLEKVVEKSKMKKNTVPKVIEQIKTVHENMDTESEETAIREYCISEPEIPKVPKSTPVKKKKGRTLIDSSSKKSIINKAIINKAIINKTISESSVESISTPTRRSSRLKK